LIAAFIPITVNLAVMSILRSESLLTSPLSIGLGASIGFLAGFATLFTMIHARKGR
jgi:hypothetical protein